jgi:hypothetical protein
MRDFTIQIYKNLLFALQQQGFLFMRFKDFQSTIQNQKNIVLRHDVDAHKENSLQFARLQHNLGIVSTYYFRIVTQSFDEKIIKEIYSLGHEVGYHYETFNSVYKKTRVLDHTFLIDTAYEEFCRNLELLRKIVPIVTICMHGSPFSKYDNRVIWRKYDYKKLGIIGDPYFDIDFERMLYLTDTGRSWSGGNVSIRDKGLGIRGKGLGEEGYKEWKVKPVSGSLMSMSQKSIDFQNKFKFRSTQDIIMAAEKGELPDKIMMTFHPQRWTDKPAPWLKELILQNVKNVGKYFLVKLRE